MKEKLINKNYLTVDLIGEPIIDMEKFYRQYSEYLEYKKNGIQNIGLFLYSVYYVDKYRFYQANSNWSNLEIVNLATNSKISFSLRDYLIDKFHSKDNEALQSKDLSIVYNKDCKNLEIFCSEQFASAMKYRESILLEDIGLFVDALISDFVESFDLNQNEKTKLVQCFIGKLIQEANNKDKSCLDEFVNHLFKKLHSLNVNTITKEQIRDYLIKYQSDISSCVFNIMQLNNFKFLENGKAKLGDLNVWQILTKKELQKYLSCNCPFKMEIKYVGQAFGDHGSRNVYDRIGNGHEHIQKLISLCPANKDVALIFFAMRPKGQILGKIDDLYSKKILKDFIKKVMDGKEDNIEASQYVNLAELALITYFRPSDNVEFKKRIFSEDNNDLKSISKIDQKYNGIIVTLDCNEFNIEIYSQKRKGSDSFIPENEVIQCKFDKEIDFIKSQLRQYRNI
ncbi:MAG TPA: hypothetical protein K8W06_01610 [Limosilactobacillus coleohominis]|nr:hypothetical protein [Limosilactobacillus coleohominis]